jgi:fructose-bisphosphate aldolase class I
MKLALNLIIIYYCHNQSRQGVKFMDTTLQATIKDLVIPGKGILAADESTPTIKKRFDTIKVESTEETRRSYRELLFTTPELEKYICGVILYEETLKQKTANGVPFPEILAKRGIVPGIKVDKGLIPLETSPEEKVTRGIDGLEERLAEYKTMGARFAKWRAVFRISDVYPSGIAIKTHAVLLSRYAKICQNLGIVPIVEPEVLMDGNHSLEKCANVSEKVFHQVFHALHKHKVSLELMVLKPNMIVAGKEHSPQPSVKEVAVATIKILRRTVPAAVPTINFLSGGQTDELATQHLQAINKIGTQPWYLSFSYGRALQAPCLKAWQGKAENVNAAQQALLERAKLNGAATL